MSEIGTICQWLKEINEWWRNIQIQMHSDLDRLLVNMAPLAFTVVCYWCACVCVCVLCNRQWMLINLHLW